MNKYAGTFPYAIDNTMRKDYLNCPQKFWLQRCVGLSMPGGVNLPILFGQCFATACKVFRRQVLSPFSIDSSFAEAINALIKEWGEIPDSDYDGRTCENCCTAFYSYVYDWGLYDQNRINLITPDSVLEIPTDIPHPDTGEEIMYCGKIDSLETDSDQNIFIVDEKTTGRMPSEPGLRFRLSGQFLGYSLLERELFSSNATTHNIEIRLIVVRKHETEFVEIPFQIENYRVDDYWAHTQVLIGSMVDDYKSKFFTKALGEACVYYNKPCQFAQLCMIKDPERWYNQFEIDKWEPWTAT